MRHIRACLRRRAIVSAIISSRDALPGQLPVMKTAACYCSERAMRRTQLQRVDVVDWEGNGTWDLVSGDEYGLIWLLRNCGTNDRPVFDPATQLQLNDEPMRLCGGTLFRREPGVLPRSDQPRCADWDGDGDLDFSAATTPTG